MVEATAQGLTWLDGNGPLSPPLRGARCGILKTMKYSSILKWQEIYTRSHGARCGILKSKKYRFSSKMTVEKKNCC